MVSSRVAWTHSRRRIWWVSAVVLLPVLILIGLAASAASALEGPAQELPIER